MPAEKHELAPGFEAERWHPGDVPHNCRYGIIEEAGPDGTLRGRCDRLGGEVVDPGDWILTRFTRGNLAISRLTDAEFRERYPDRG